MRNEHTTMQRQYESDMGILKDAIATRGTQIEVELELPVGVRTKASKLVTDNFFSTQFFLTE